MIGVVAIGIFGLRAAGVFESPPVKVDLNAAGNIVAAGETVGTKMSGQGNTHIADGQRFTYNSTPPTSGSHWQQWTPWGIKDGQEANERTTHNLEHGGIVIGYGPGLPPDDAVKLKSLVRGLSGSGFPKIVVEPYQQLSDAKVAATAWTWIIKLPEYDESQIVKFVKAHYQTPDAPEPNGP